MDTWVVQVIQGGSCSIEKSYTFERSQFPKGNLVKTIEFFD
jgi:hypothetical protein